MNRQSVAALSGDPQTLGVWPEGNMRALQITAPGHVKLAEIPIPKPWPDGVLVRTSYVGLCGTDLELFHGATSYQKDGRATFPLVFGHEWSGQVVAVGEAARGFAVGDRVVGQTMVSCGLCRMCQRGKRQLCERLVEVGLYGIQGAAATYIQMPPRSLTLLPDTISDATAALIEPAVTVVGAFNKVNCKLEDTVAVVGTGTIGLLAVQLASRVARDVVAIGIDEAGLELALACGATQALLPEEAKREGYSVVIEASGAPVAFLRSLEIAEPGGRVALIGVANDEVSGLVPGDFGLRGIDIFGIRHGLDYYDQTIHLFATGVLNADLLIAEVLSPEQAAQAFEFLEHGRSGPPKVLLRFNDESCQSAQA